MAMSKSFGLKKAGGATSKAFRRLFGRVLSSGGSEGTAGSRTGSSSFDSSNLYSSTHDESKSTKAENKERASSEVDKRHSSAPQLSTIGTPAGNNDTGATDKMTLVSKKDVNKENQPPSTSALEESLAGLTLKDKNEKPIDVKDEKAIAVEPTPKPPSLPIDEDPAAVAERMRNLEFIGEALDMVSTSQLMASGILARRSLWPAT